MAYSVQRAVSDGTLVLLDISIDYLDRSEITVYFNDVVSTSGWAWVGSTDKKISFSPAVPNGVQVTVKRTTDLSKLRHEFSGGAAFVAEVLDEDLKQVLHIAQEATEGALGGDFYTDLDMHYYKIKNLGTAVDPNDAVPLGQYQADAAGAWVARTGVEAARDTSVLASTTAVSAKAVAVSAKDTAVASASTATTKATEATASANAALVSKNAAEAAYDSFDDRYLGSKATEPTTDNDGNPLLVGALFYHTGTGMKVWSGSVWEIALVGTSAIVTKVNPTTSGTFAHTGNATVSGTLAMGSQFGFRNRLINGNFAINQREVSGTVTLGAGAYGHDRWKAGASGCTYTFATVNNVTTLTITAGSLQQIIEGVNLQSGTHTLSWAGTAQGKIGAGAYSISGVTGAVTGGVNLTVEFNTGTVLLAQFEPGNIATPFEHRPIGIEGGLCRRYYRSYMDMRFLVLLRITGFADRFTPPRHLYDGMRIDPNVTYYTQSGSPGALTEFSNGGDFAVADSGMFITTSAATTYDMIYRATASAEL